MFLLWQTHPDQHTQTRAWTCCHFHSTQSWTHFRFSPSLAQAISQPRFSLAYYTFTYIRSVLKRRRTQRLIILLRSCYRDQTCDLSRLWAALPTLGHPSLARVHSSRSHRFSDVSFPQLCVIHLQSAGSSSPLFNFPFSLAWKTNQILLWMCVWWGRVRLR